MKYSKYLKKLKNLLKQTKNFLKKSSKTLLWLGGSFFLVIIGLVLIWASTLKLPNLDSFDARKISSSTKIFDRTGEVILFDVHKDIKRTLVAPEDISIYAKNAAVAIEDDQFYQHQGVDVRGTLRGILYSGLSIIGVRSGPLQGGSTITQQVVKNTLLTSDRKISRKIKEWFLAVKLEQKLSKDEILAQYLNIAPYGGTIYGIEQASQSFFDKTSADITLAEAAYLAAIPNAPTYYSPYGNNKERLEARKNLVLLKMLELGFITQEEYKNATEEEVTFMPREDNFSKAFHFVEYVRSYVEGRYGKDAVENDGLRVTTTLDYDLQKYAEEIVAKNAIENEEKWDAHNQGVIVIDPKTGQILTMVGSRDYFDTEIDGNFNVTLAKRQPGSSFKPFIYARAFEEGYTPDTVLFDTRTQFTASCPPTNLTSNGNCYSPQNYDNLYQGPITLRNALAQSRNVPAVKLLYLVGTKDALRFAKDAGITTLGDADIYGLTLVLGGGEVSLLDMTSAYGVFANGGVRNTPTGILRIEDKDGNILEEYKSRPQQALDHQAVALLNDVLSDNQARTPLFGTSNNFMYFGDDRSVAAKTGTTNSSRDAWLVGYSPDIAVGVWTGNNDNTPMKRGSSISGSTWRAVMLEALKSFPNSHFEEPAAIQDYEQLKPVLRGEWKGGETVLIDGISKKLATELTPQETLEEIPIINPHSILHWIDKNNPTGPIPQNPASDNQYDQWEIPVQQWLQQHSYLIGTQQSIPTMEDNIHTIANKPSIKILSPDTGDSVESDDDVHITVKTSGNFQIEKVNYFVNNVFIGSSDSKPFSFTFRPNEVTSIREKNTIKAIVYDEVYNSQEDTIDFTVK